MVFWVVAECIAKAAIAGGVIQLMLSNGSQYLMLIGAIDWLLGLDRARWSDPRTFVGWQHALPGWQWMLIVIAAVFVAALSYRHLDASRVARVGLVIIRGAVLLAVVVLLAGPVMILPDVNIEKDRLLMLVDRSQSMTVADCRLDPDPSLKPVSRDQVLRKAIERQADVFSDPDFLHHRQITWLGFDSTTYGISGPGVTGKELIWAAATGRTTDIRSAIDQALQTVGGSPVAGVVLMTDGRSTQATSMQFVRRLQRQAVRIYPVPLGGDVQTVDLAIRRVDVSQRAFVNDDVPVRVLVGRFRHDVQSRFDMLRLELIDEQTRQVLDEHNLSDNGGEQAVVLKGRSAVIGPINWRVNLSAELPYAGVVDPVPDNNTALVVVEMISRPIRLLYIEGYPRWEYRYLKNMLVRETSISSSIMLTSADHRFIQEGNKPITRLPETSEEWAQFDVIIIGDVPHDYLSRQQMIQLRDHMAGRGGGLIWIGGDHYTPHRYEGTLMADMLAMVRPGDVKRTDAGSGVSMYPTVLADSLNVLQLKHDGSSSGWPSALPPLHWVQDVGLIKPTAGIIAASRSSDLQAVGSENESSLPLVIRMPFGAGQSVYIATDETWRWRYGQGGHYFEQFWIGLIRMMGRHRIQQHGQQAQFNVGQARVEQGQAVAIELEIEDPLLLQQHLPRILVAVDQILDGRSQRFEMVDLAQVVSSQLPSSDGRYRGTWKPSLPGRYRLQVVEPVLDELQLSSVIEVIQHGDEMQEVRPDHIRLYQLAEQTGGKVVGIDELDTLVKTVTSRATATSNDLSEPLARSPMTFLVIIVLLTTEWVGRKLVRLA